MEEDLVLPAERLGIAVCRHISAVLVGVRKVKWTGKEAEETVLDAARNMAQLISENLEKKKSEWHKTILKEENIATLESEKSDSRQEK